MVDTGTIRLRGDKMIKALINADLDDKNIEKLKKIQGYDFKIVKGSQEACKYIEESEVYITFTLDKKHIMMGKNLKWIAVLYAGVEHLPLDLIKEKNILLTNGKGIAGTFMAEYVISMMIMLARNLKIVEKNSENKIWNNNITQDQIFGKTVGILGLGSIGSKIAKNSKLLGMRVIGLKRTKTEVDYVDKVYTGDEMGEIFSLSDYIVNVLPLTEKTQKIIDCKYFSLMNSESYYINIGRGKTTNEEDLIKALKENKIKGAALDVFYNEPLPKDNPLWDMKNVIITPHLSGISKIYIEKALDNLIPNFEAYRDNKKMNNIINLEMGY
jgi:D-2-hydroxyacid dehydrogenase (NADP+)